MSLARYFVFPFDEQWLVSLDGALIGRHDRRETAVGSAIVMADLMGAMQHDADVLLEENGHLDIFWTFGVDPLPSRATEAIQ